MKIGDEVVCAWAGTFTGLTTGKVYKINDVYPDHGITYITILDDNNKRGSYDASRFNTVQDIAKQVQENNL